MTPKIEFLVKDFFKCMLYLAEVLLPKSKVWAQLKVTSLAEPRLGVRLENLGNTYELVYEHPVFVLYGWENEEFQKLKTIEICMLPRWLLRFLQDLVHGVQLSVAEAEALRKPIFADFVSAINVLHKILFLPPRPQNKPKGHDWSVKADEIFYSLTLQDGSVLSLGLKLEDDQPAYTVTHEKEIITCNKFSDALAVWANYLPNMPIGKKEQDVFNWHSEAPAVMLALVWGLNNHYLLRKGPVCTFSLYPLDMQMKRFYWELDLGWMNDSRSKPIQLSLRYEPSNNVLEIWNNQRLFEHKPPQPVLSTKDLGNCLVEDFLEMLRNDIPAQELTPEELFTSAVINMLYAFLFWDRNILQDINGWEPEIMKMHKPTHYGLCFDLYIGPERGNRKLRRLTPPNLSNDFKWTVQVCKPGEQPSDSRNYDLAARYSLFTAFQALCELGILTPDIDPSGEGRTKEYWALPLENIKNDFIC